MFLAQVDPDDPWVDAYELGWSAEVPVLFFASVVALYGAYRFFPLATHKLLVASPNPGLGIVRASLAFALAWFWLVLQTGAARDIVGFYTWLYVALSIALLFLGGFLRPVLDLYFPADVVERGNLAAGLVYAGFVLGTAFAFGGALTGEGPGWWVVVVFFLLAYFELRANMALVSRLSGRLKEDVRLERDASAGLLLGAVATASGLVSGAAAAGDFLGWGHGLPDYLGKLWPLLLVAGGGTLAGLYTRDREDKLHRRAYAAGALVLAALAYYLYVVIVTPT